MVNTPRLTILDVGHGNSAVLQDTEGVVVIDAGSRNSLLEFLREAEITRIDVILISHADEDHLGGLLAILASGVFELGRVRMNTDATKKSALWDDVVYELDRLRQARRVDFEPTLTSDDSGTYDQGSVHIQVLAPSAYLAGKGPGSNDRVGRTISTNSISAVIRLVWEGNPLVLLPGDIDYVGFTNLLESGLDASAQVLVFPHHGGHCGADDLTAFALALCELVQPDVVVFSIGRNKFTNPQPEAVRGIRQSGRQIWIACTQLSKHCAAGVPASGPAHLVQEFAAGKEARQCCAGTLVFDLDSARLGALPVLPTFSEHQGFIGDSAPTALCRRRFSP
jgi:beta-lactamase superfamily II metal-dependent hydrolase